MVFLFFFLFYVSDVVEMSLDQLAGLVPLAKKILKTLHSVPRTKASWQAGRFFILVNFRCYVWITKTSWDDFGVAPRLIETQFMMLA